MSSQVEIKVIRRRASESRMGKEPTSVAKDRYSEQRPGSTEGGAMCPERESCRSLLEMVIRGLVDHPESISVTYSVGDRTTIYKVDCDQRCLGQIIGSKGKNISGVRAVIAATMARKGIRAIVEIPYYTLET